MIALRVLAVSVAMTALMSPVAASANVVTTRTHHHACTRTSSGSCIRGGEFCKQAQFGYRGYDSDGRRYICKGSHTHPHWELP